MKGSRKWEKGQALTQMVQERMPSSKIISAALNRKAGKHSGRSLWPSSLFLTLRTWSCWNLLSLSVASQNCYSNVSGLPLISCFPTEGKRFSLCEINTYKVCPKSFLQSHISTLQSFIRTVQLLYLPFKCNASPNHLKSYVRSQSPFCQKKNVHVINILEGLTWNIKLEGEKKRSVVAIIFIYKNKLIKMGCDEVTLLVLISSFGYKNKACLYFHHTNYSPINCCKLICGYIILKWVLQIHMFLKPLKMRMWNGFWRYSEMLWKTQVLGNHNEENKEWVKHFLS